MFGGSVSEMYAQDDNGQKINIESNDAYKKQFLHSVSPDLDKIKVDFVVDSVETKISNGELLPDVNIIQLLAYLDQDSDEYQSYMASRHIVAHEMWHRICMMNDVLEKPMSATQYRTGRDNFEISASIVQLLTFRDDYIQASPEQRLQLHKLDDPKIKMYLLAVDNDIIRPLSNDKKDFDFEMEFIAKMVSGYWNNNLSATYAQRHNAMTEKANRKEFKSPIYEKNFTQDIKVMNHIGGIDFSKLYNYKDVRFLKKFKPADKADTNQLNTSLSSPNFETWLNKKSKLKRFSKQTIQIPNFTGNRLVDEREKRSLNERVQPFQIANMSVGYKVYPLMKVPFYSAVTLQKNETFYNLYPHGAMDVIQQSDAHGVANIKTLYIDGSREEGQLHNGVKVGTFRFFDKNRKIIASCSFNNNRAISGQVALPASDGYILYTYKAGKLTSLEEMSNKGVKKIICRIENGKPVSGLVPMVSPKDNHIQRSYQAYQDGKLVAALIFDDFNRLKEKQKIKDKTIRIERFYDTGALKYQAVAVAPSLPAPLVTKNHENVEPLSRSLISKSSFPQTKPIEMQKNIETSLEPTLPVSPKNMVKTIDKQPFIPQNGSVPLSPLSDKKVDLQASQHPIPILLQEILLSAQGNPVIALSKQKNGKNNLKVRVKEFFEVLKQTTLPKMDKQLIMSGIVKLRHQFLSLTDSEALSSDKQLLGKQHHRREKSSLPRINQPFLPPKSVISTSSSRTLPIAMPKISLFKNKFRFFMLKQRETDKS